jgi:hypothetical protein
MSDSPLETKPSSTTSTLKNKFWDAVTKTFAAELDRASEQKQSYTRKLEEAAGEDVFKYLLLINVSALEAYVAQTRIQAQQSFNASKWAAGIGFALIITGIVLGIYPFHNKDIPITAAYLAGLKSGHI